MITRMPGLDAQCLHPRPQFKIIDCELPHLRQQLDVFNAGSRMTKYLISFPSEAMVLTEEEFPIVAADAHAVIEEAKMAGVYVFGGGIEEQVDPVLVSADGSISPDTYPGSHLTGGFTVLELPTRDDAVLWASKIAAACRCSQELREFGYDPAS